MFDYRACLRPVMFAGLFAELWCWDGVKLNTDKVAAASVDAREPRPQGTAIACRVREFATRLAAGRLLAASRGQRSTAR